MLGWHDVQRHALVVRQARDKGCCKCGVSEDLMVSLSNREVRERWRSRLCGNDVVLYRGSGLHRYASGGPEMREASSGVVRRRAR